MRTVGGICLQSPNDARCNRFLFKDSNFKTFFLTHRKHEHRNWGDEFVGKILAVKARGAEFESPAPTSRWSADVSVESEGGDR